MPTFKDIYIDSLMVDSTFNLKLNEFFLMFQTIASIDASRIGTGKEVIVKKNQDWVITRATVEFYEDIKFDETVELYTYPSDLKGGFVFLRNGGIKKKDGTYAAKISSMWAIINNETRRIEFKPNLPYVAESIKGETPLESSPKISNEPCSPLYKRVMRYSDCDVNGHVNNTRYIEMISDIYPLEFYKTHKLKRIDINYVSELYDGDKVTIYTNEDMTYVEGRVNDKVSFLAKLAFINR